MFRNILVPLDGSQTSEKILAHVETLARVCNAAVHLAHVADRNAAAIAGGRSYLAELQIRVQDRFENVDAALLKGNPQRQLLALSMFRNYDLIALVTHGRAGIKRLLYGSAAEELLRKSRLPLYLARPHVDPKPPKRILIPLDGSNRSSKILPLVGDLAKALAAKVSLLHVTPAPVPESLAAENLESAKKTLVSLGIEATLEKVAGDPVKQVLETARKSGAGLIALTTHGRTGLDRVRFGSVAEEILRGSEVPMLVLRTAFLSRLDRKKVAVPKGQGKTAKSMVPEMVEAASHLPRPPGFAKI